MNLDQGAGGYEFHCKIPVPDRIHTVGRNGRKVQFPGHEIAIYRETGPCQGRCPQRHYIYPFQAVGKPFSVTAEHLVIGQHVVRDEHGLRALKMRITRHDGAQVFTGRADKCLLKPG